MSYGLFVGDETTPRLVTHSFKEAHWGIDLLSVDDLQRGWTIKPTDFWPQQTRPLPTLTDVIVTGLGSMVLLGVMFLTALLTRGCR